MNKNNLLLALVSIFLLLSLTTSKFAVADNVISDEKLQALGINPAEIKSQVKTSYGVTSLFAIYVGLVQRYLVLTNDTLYVVTDDDRGIDLTLPLSNIESAEMKVINHLFGKSRNIQLKTDHAIIVFDFVLGKAELGDKFFSALVATGVKVSKSVVVKDNSVEGRHVVRTIEPN